jgi:hypothetical protein
MRQIPAIATGVLLVLSAALPTAATPAHGPPEPVSLVIDLPAGAACAFPVRIEAHGKTKTIALPGGRTIVTSPGLEATVTNLASPNNRVTLNVTGAFHQRILDNGNVETVSTGRSLLVDPEAGFVLARGRFSFVFDAGGTLVQPLTGKGKLTDVCELLT